jgi:thymidylate kinase
MIIIYISGIDGCGKTTQSELLVEWLEQEGYSAGYQWLRWEPSILPILQKIRSLFGKTSSKSTTISTSSDKRESENKAHGRWSSLKGSLMASHIFRYFWMKYATSDYFSTYKKTCGNWQSDYIVMDRYIFDFVVDQSLNFGIQPREFLTASESTKLSNMQKPEFSVFINIPAEVGYERKLDGTPLQYLKKREALYGNFNDNNVLQVNGEQSPDSIHQEITQWLAPKLVKYNG